VIAVSSGSFFEADGVADFFLEGTLFSADFSFFLFSKAFPIAIID
jgi:hypothetical protein